MTTHNENEDENKNNAEEEQYEKPKHIKSRTREIDFMRIEDTMHGQPLTHFELKVKAKIACVPSPYEEIARKEDEESKSEQIQNTLNELVEKALTPKQKAWFHMVYVEELSDREIAKRLNVTDRRVCYLKADTFKAFKRAYEKQQIKQLLDNCDLTEKQRLIAQLRYEEQLTLKEIASRLGVTLRAVDDVLGRIRRNFFPKKN
ncbi:MAG: sigma factor-like helix-turn-helix DNA-binding protein [Candidatus Harrisonbacteria bacterium]|nr:sigma factor-like helix-turn-helix DNA-binding protein [Candidatus Harrisonbacteria bacterium]